MKLTYRLLEHPFYQAWNEGKVSMEQLSKYAASYAEFIGRMPVYWKRISDAFDTDNPDLLKIENEEQEHIALWESWTSKMDRSNEYPKMDKIFEAFDNMSPSELLGAVHAFEVQQPEVAETKKRGLIGHYGFSASDLSYFDEHMQEEAHIKLGIAMADKHADHEQFKSGFETGSRLIYEGLDLFVN
ncbi:MAG: hypothetical protein U5Q03_20200 [Bacteroidota bacterium]|nr:hypothetical protein [Bacteroidota bacterium]